jgi:hypothetical protein
MGYVRTFYPLSSGVLRIDESSVSDFHVVVGNDQVDFVVIVHGEEELDGISLAADILFHTLSGSDLPLDGAIAIRG